MNLSLCPICGKLSEEEQTALFSSLDYSTRSFKKGDWVIISVFTRPLLNR